MILSRSMIAVVVGYLIGIGYVHGNETCYEGYITDTFCLNQDAFLDDPAHQPLVNPELHTALCLLDPPQCREAFEILADPVDSGANYTRAIRLDENGVAMAIDYATKAGKGCSNCTGTVEMGIRVSVTGVLSSAVSSEGIPIFNVTSIESPTAGCASMPATMPSMPVAAPVAAPTGSSGVHVITTKIMWSAVLAITMMGQFAISV